MIDRAEGKNTFPLQDSPFVLPLMTDLLENDRLAKCVQVFRHLNQMRVLWKVMDRHKC